MNSLLADIGLLASQNLFLAYFIIYIATIFLGNISAFAGFWFIFQGYLGAWGVPLLILTIFCADISGDVLWYSLGRALHNTPFGNWIKRRLPGYEKLESRVTRHGARLIFLAKFVYASSFPVIFSVGWTQMEFKKFFRYSLLSIAVWLPILLGLAYGVISGLWPLRTITVFKDFEWFFLVGLVLFIILDYFLARAVGKLLSWRNRRKNKEEDLFEEV